MKKLFLALFCAMLFLGTSAQEQQISKNQKKKVLVAATVNESAQPGIEGVRKFEAFLQGDTSYLVDERAPRGVRKECLKMARQLCKQGCMTYNEYAQLANELGLKPKPRKRF